MTDWTRRRVLLSGLGITGITTGLAEGVRRRSFALRQAQRSGELLNDPEVVNRAVSNAIEGDREATAEVERILAGLDLRPPDSPYERSISKTLIRASRLATEQYLTGKFDLRFDGSIRGLPAYSDTFHTYTQVASIKGPDTVNAEKLIMVDDPDGPHNALLVGSKRLRNLITGYAGRAQVIRWSYPVYWGFVLTAPSHHLLVLRGTQRGHEWLQTLRARQVVTAEVPEFDFPGSIHHGFATIYARLSKPVIQAARNLDPTRPLFVAGHSLGSPLATLAALDIARKIPALQPYLRLYSYAGPRLGDPTFAEAFSRIIPNSYRIVNQADLVPTLPPTRTGQITYVHMGQPWGFTTASGDIGPNHFISVYREAVDREREQPLQDDGRLGR